MNRNYRHTESNMLLEMCYDNERVEKRHQKEKVP